MFCILAHRTVRYDYWVVRIYWLWSDRLREKKCLSWHVCMYDCVYNIYIYIYACIHTYMRTDTHAYMHTRCLHRNIQTCCMYGHTKCYICVCMHTRTHIFAGKDYQIRCAGRCSINYLHISAATRPQRSQCKSHRHLSNFLLYSFE